MTLEHPAGSAPAAWTTSDDLDQLAPAFVAALGDLDDVARTRTADTGGWSYRYADLGDVLAQARAVLARHDLAVSQVAAVDRGDVVVTTTVWHTSGQWLTAAPLRLAAGQTAQHIGSAITYARRYALMALLGVAAEDDDGATAASRPADEPLMRPDNVARFLTAAAEANLTGDEIAAVVADATGGRTTDPAQVYSSERDVLRTAFDTATAERAADTGEDEQLETAQPSDGRSIDDLTSAMAGLSPDARRRMASEWTNHGQR